MINYYFAEKGKFLSKDFQDKIKEAKTFLTKNDSLDEIVFNEVRFSWEIGYTIGEINYAGNFITYEMKKGNDLIAHLNCFISSENDYMEVISTKV